MFLTELTITRLDKLKDRTNLTDDDLTTLAADVEPLDPRDLESNVFDPENVEDEPEAVEEPENPNYAGVIRVVPGAHLVYKRSQPDGTFTELWVYKVGDVKTAFKIRNNILSGTDIESKQLQSSDGSQQYDLWTAGNTSILSITGLPN